ncbi:putative tRNA-dihydrouridine synthase [Anopheles sinensis]|uniref:Putative tRNA-dihydrouridine synthase n=1 Tax=Anopheles sinensis TaxID=74873 RepID=A0A084WT05_ANOSI|nr:putative tRNA-dihydrouridine synthase [Anopheles sinensis]
MVDEVNPSSNMPAGRPAEVASETRLTARTPTPLHGCAIAQPKHASALFAHVGACSGLTFLPGCVLPASFSVYARSVNERPPPSAPSLRLIKASQTGMFFRGADEGNRASHRHMDTRSRYFVCLSHRRSPPSSFGTGASLRHHSGNGLPAFWSMILNPKARVAA